jgi:hypothetical protein
VPLAESLFCPWEPFPGGDRRLLRRAISRGSINRRSQARALRTRVSESTLCPLGQSNKAIGHESPIGPCIATLEWTIVRLVVSEKRWRRHNSEMEPQGRTIASPFHARRRCQTFRTGKTTLRLRVHVQAVGLNAETKNRSASSRGRDFCLDIPFYRTSTV